MEYDGIGLTMWGIATSRRIAALLPNWQLNSHTILFIQTIPPEPDFTRVHSWECVPHIPRTTHTWSDAGHIQNKPVKKAHHPAYHVLRVSWKRSHAAVSHSLHRRVFKTGLGHLAVGSLGNSWVEARFFCMCCIPLIEDSTSRSGIPHVEWGNSMSEASRSSSARPRATLRDSAQLRAIPRNLNTLH